MSAFFVLVIPVIEEGVQKFDTEAEVRRGDTSEIWGVQFEVLLSPVPTYLSLPYPEDGRAGPAWTGWDKLPFVTQPQLSLQIMPFRVVVCLLALMCFC
eukprot:scaffold5100_cov110-Skeletonema_marinoi.AAC.7